MKTYANLELNHFYLVRENEGDKVALLEPIMETENCFLLTEHDEYENTFWKEKSDPINGLLEQLTDEQVVLYNSLFEDDEEDDDDDEFEFEESFLEDDDELEEKN